MRSQPARKVETEMVAEHSLETRIALLELQVKNLADALLLHMEQEVAAMDRINEQLRNLQKSAWVVSSIERLGWIIVAAATTWIMKG